MNQMLQRLSPLTKATSTDGESAFDLRGIIHFLWRQWRFIASVSVVVVVVALVNLAREVPLYTGTAQVLLDPRKEKAGNGDAILTDLKIDFATIESQIAIIRSTMFLKRVVEREHLTTDPEFGTRSGVEPTPSLFTTIRRSIFGAPNPPPKPPVSDQPTEAEIMSTVEALKGAISVVRLNSVYILAISATARDPKRAAFIANAVADTYIVDQLDVRFEAAQRASTWLAERLADLRNQLRVSEEAVAKFRAEHGIAETSNVTVSQQQLSDLNTRLVTARAETADKKARLDLLNTIEAKGGNVLNALPDVSALGTLSALRAQDMAISQKESDLVARYSDNHPLVINIRAEHRDVQRAIATEIKRVAANVKNEYELAKARQNSLEASIGQVTGQTGLDSETTIKLRELERTAASNKSIFEDYLKRSKITQEQSTFVSQEVRVITPATVPGAPSYPRKSRTIFGALIFGLFLGIGGAYAKELLNSGFTTVRQAEELLELPVLASVSRMSNADLTIGGKLLTIPNYLTERPLSRYSEAIRGLRSGVQMTDVDNPPKVIQVGSTMPSEGKTTIALSLAASAANSGLNVLLVDADLRHPSASRFLGMHKEAGLVDLLLGQVTLQDVLKQRPDFNFWIIPAGSKTQNPPDLLASERMKSLVASFRKSFDYIVIDSPPIGPVIDSAVIAQLADKVVFVVRWAATAREMVQQSVQQLSGHKKIAGIVFNQVNENEAQKYGKYAYSYYYGSRYYKRYYSE